MAVEPQVVLPVEFVDFDGTPGSGTPFDAAHMNPNAQALRDAVNEHTHLVGDARDAPVGDGLWERSSGGMVLRDPASFVGSDDARLTDARVPLAHSASHLGGGDDLLPTLDERYAGVAAAVSKSLIMTKGDLIVGTGAGAVARLGAGPNGDIPVADSTQASGLRWDTPANALGGSLSPAFDFTGPVSEQLPTFTKDAGNPILAAADLTAAMTSLGWPWLIAVESIFGGIGPYNERFRCYYSTDHQTDSASIGLLTASQITGPWTDQGQVFQDTTGGNQCENPAVIYDDLNQRFNLYYHMVNATGAVSSEVEKLATMSLASAQAGPDDWTVSDVNGTGIVLDLPENGFWPSNGGWGYMRPWRVGNFWYAHYRSGGGTDVMFGLARSRDGEIWFQDGRQIFFQAHLMNDPLGRFNPSSHYPDWGGGNVLRWRGQWWWLGVLLPNAVQYQSPHPAWMVMAPLSSDFRRFTAVPSVLFETSQGWEDPSDGWVAGMGNFRYGCSAIVVNGEIHLAYLNGQINQNNDHDQAANFASGIGMAVGA